MTTRHVLGLSGGKDSAALAIFMRQYYPEIEVEYYFTDTGKELPEVYDFLSRLEGFLGREIVRLNPHRDFDFWLREYGHFLPNPRTRWCTRQLKLLPFRQWLKPWIDSGNSVVSYVAIRADEDHREGYVPTSQSIQVRFPFRDEGIDRQGVLDLLERSGVGLPDYYKWRSRSGCTFCFFQQKIEWVRLRETHPAAFEEAKRYEKDALSHGSPFTWSAGESLSDLEKPDRVASIKAEFLVRRSRAKDRARPNPLAPEQISGPQMDIDDLYLEDEGGGACLVCHK